MQIREHTSSPYTIKPQPSEGRRFLLDGRDAPAHVKSCSQVRLAENDSWKSSKTSNVAFSTTVLYLNSRLSYTDTMRFLGSIALSLLSLTATTVVGASWGFEDATVTVQGKGAGVGGAQKEKYV